MSERARAMAAFDEAYDIPEGVSLVAVEIPFWNMVNLMVKAYFAWLVASVIIGIPIGIIWIAILWAGSD